MVSSFHLRFFVPSNFEDKTLGRHIRIFPPALQFCSEAAALIVWTIRLGSFLVQVNIIVTPPTRAIV